MGINAKHFRECIVRPVLHYLDPVIPYSRAAENLLMGTAAQESHLGTYLRQVRGPARGVYQMEPNTAIWLALRLISRDKEICKKVENLRLKTTDSVPTSVQGNLYFATALARYRYWVVPHKLPGERNIAGLAHYWKNYYNTRRGKGEVEEFIQNYHRLVLRRIP